MKQIVFEKLTVKEEKNVRGGEGDPYLDACPVNPYLDECVQERPYAACQI